MKPGYSRFDFFLSQLQALIDEAIKQEDPGLWLYQNNARTPLFMLEALAKMYAAFHNKRKFTRIREHFKLVEDALGAVDYYDAIAKGLSGNKKLPPKIVPYLQAKTVEHLQGLNELLLAKGWLEPINHRVGKIRKKLLDAAWAGEATEVRQIEAFYHHSISQIVAFAGASAFKFNNIESEVHELRRKLRWLSIYPQALRGAVQLVSPRAVPMTVAKYCTPAITGSAFNKMPDAGALTAFLLLETNYFYSLSWMIAELGTIKDQGLNLVAVTEALQETSGAGSETAEMQALQILGKKQPRMQALLDEAGAICKRYFEESNLEQLVVGASIRAACAG